MKLAHYRIILWLCLLLLSQSGCIKSLDSTAAQQTTESQKPKQPEAQKAPDKSPPEYPELEFFDEWADDEKDSVPLDYNGFHIQKKTKKVLLEETIKPTELSFAQISRKGKTVMTFDGVEHPHGNETRFGLFPLLSPDSRQLLVQQNAWRSSRQWIVSLDTQAKVLIDSRDYQLEGFGAMDLDRDGQFELSGFHKYWHFEFLPDMTFSSADSPEIRIVFAYNQKTKKYEPANPRYKVYLLERIEQIKARFAGTNVDPRDGYSLMSRMSDVMEGTMTLALVGDEAAAWEFFDQYCPAEKPEEKAEAKSRIQFAIKQNTIYKLLKRTHQIK